MKIINIIVLLIPITVSVVTKADTPKPTPPVTTTQLTYLINYTMDGSAHVYDDYVKCSINTCDKEVKKRVNELKKLGAQDIEISEVK